MSNRAVFAGLAAVLLAHLLWSTVTDRTILVDGRIYTGATTRPWVEALAIEDGVIQAIGTSEGIREHVSWNTTVVDLEGRMVMPGFHDAHIHIVMGAIGRRVYCRLRPNLAPDEIVEVLKQCRRDGTMTDGWLIGGNYNPMKFPNANPDNAFLDEHFPDIPVYLNDYSQHVALVNGKALEVLGIPADVANPPAGEYARDPVTGELTGLLLETAKYHVNYLVPQPGPLEALRVVRETLAEMSRFGITSAQEAGALPEIVQLLSILDRVGLLPLEIDAHWVQEATAVPSVPVEMQRAWLADRATWATANLHTDRVKVILDGVPLPPTPSHATLDPETGEVDAHRLTVSAAILAERMIEWDAMGLTAKIHAIGDGAARVAIEAIAAAREANGDSGILHGVAHAQGTHIEDRPRFAALDAVIEFSPTFWSEPDRGTGVVFPFWFESAVDSGAVLTIGSDWPVVESMNPFPALAGMLDFGDESVDLETAVRVMTSNGARSMGREDTNGTLEPGRWANLIVLDRNLFDVAPAEIAETKVLRTWFRGEEVYRRAEQEGSE